MNDDLWDRVHEVGSETKKGYERAELLVVLEILEYQKKRLKQLCKASIKGDERG